MSYRGTYQNAVLDTQEDRDNFMAMSAEEKGEFAYKLWSANNYNMPVPGIGPCSENIAWWDQGETPEKEDFATKFNANREPVSFDRKAYREACRDAERRQRECVATCAECPLLAQCFTASITRPEKIRGRTEPDRDGLVCEDNGLIWGGATYDERISAWETVLELWGEDIYRGEPNAATGYDRFVLFETRLRAELGDEEFERLREAAQHTSHSQKRSE